MTWTWTSRQWAALVGVLVLVILVLTLLWPRQAAAPRSVVIEVVDGPTVLSTQVVPLHR
ncbi:MAG: hypothetical protein M3069_09875 [Chloroflexota bacterium]|nr:hypothetical protein [Chloroflexota bacterium]